MYRCVLYNIDGDLLVERHDEDIFCVDLTWSPGSEEILKKGGSIVFTYVGALQKCESDEGFI